ncbi:nucleoside-diphosphate kinase [Paenibacillus pini]|uniref:Nucleoside diphosphate kinase-like domain-containing protein n=1 Tax=Paenibacillus pini JCM 16418 TaxID=1236976 RepID=W7Z4F0_9BACL|nr:nucleoside-diphosphate kinase [Paenibacillus pini]GAF09239.1 hypothetical protein JCM16418_3360 [Paenibacillus pini JCM 16418]
MDKNTCFAMITPDALIRGKTEEVIDYLLDKNIQIKNFLIKKLSEREIEEVYKLTYLEKVESFKRTHWWLTKETYAHYPAILLLLETNNLPDGYDNLPLYIKSFKGKSDPYRNDEHNSLRYRIGSLSKTLALFHSSDDLSSSERESSIFFNKGFLNKGNIHAIYSKEYILESLQFTDYQETSLYDSLYKIKKRVLYKLNYYLESSSNNIWSNIHNQLVNLYDQIEANTNMNFIEQHMYYKKFLEEEKKIMYSNQAIVIEIIQKLLIHEKGNIENEIFLKELYSLYIILLTLSDFENFPKVDFEELEVISSSQNIYITTWEKILLKNLLFFYVHEGGEKNV